MGVSVSVLGGVRKRMSLQFFLYLLPCDYLLRFSLNTASVCVFVFTTITASTTATAAAAAATPTTVLLLIILVPVGSPFTW